MSDRAITTEEEFDNLLSDGTYRVVVLFTAPAWCVPCRRVEPHWKLASEQVGNRVIFASVNMGETPEDTGSHWATARFGIRGVPQIKLWHIGELGPVDVKARTAVAIIKELTGG